MEDIVRQARIAAQRKAQYDRLVSRLVEQRRLDFSDISRHIVREADLREWAIRELVEAGRATVEFDYATGGRPRTTLVLIE